MEVTNLEMIDKIHDMVLSDRRIKVREISARCVPRLLLEEYKHNRVVGSVAILALFRCNPDEFLSRYVTVDETYHYSPETKEQSKQSVFKGERIPKNHLHLLFAKRTNDN